MTTPRTGVPDLRQKDPFSRKERKQGLDCVKTGNMRLKEGHNPIRIGNRSRKNTPSCGVSGEKNKQMPVPSQLGPRDEKGKDPPGQMDSQTLHANKCLV